MSKMDGLRAMREARYARAGAQAPRPAAARTTPPVAPPAPRAEVRRSAAAPTAPPPGEAEALCGHRAISGRTCTREKGHTAKSHRYS